MHFKLGGMNEDPEVTMDLEMDIGPKSPEIGELSGRMSSSERWRRIAISSQRLPPDYQIE